MHKILKDIINLFFWATFIVGGFLIGRVATSTMCSLGFDIDLIAKSQYAISTTLVGWIIMSLVGIAYSKITRVLGRW